MKSKSRHVYKTGNITGPAIYVLNNVYFNTMKILFFFFLIHFLKENSTPKSLQVTYHVVRRETGSIQTC